MHITSALPHTPIAPTHGRDFSEQKAITLCATSQLSLIVTTSWKVPSSIAHAQAELADA